MTTQGNGQSPGAYRVLMSEEIRSEVRRKYLEAQQRGTGQQFIHAFRQITQRLRTDPLIFGEPQYRLLALKLSVRQAVVAPIVVDYAVHEERPVVFIRVFKVLA